jgi:tRNA threonylcarbamoyladenosine biosynthesis protein TsaE
MSTFESCVLKAESPEKTQLIAFSLANSLYKRPLTISLSGELGAGKTTFAQGFAKGLGIDEQVVSPTFALEQRYGDTFIHSDLYRLNTAQAHDTLRHTEDFAGIRLIEWSERAAADELRADIAITIKEEAEGREIHIQFDDLAIPTVAQAEKWIEEVHLPEHIQRHTKKVAEVSAELADDLIRRGTVVRKTALVRAAELHDLLRFLDFPTWEGDPLYSPTKEDVRIWTSVKEKYAGRHEVAIGKFLVDKGFPGLAEIARTHRGNDEDENNLPKSTEQLLLAYADKRVRFDKIVSVQQRFDDFVERYGKGTESENAKFWRKTMLAMEARFFPDGPPI